jgi:pimeloyl-ACP methyl ester carboxylesterase
MPIAPPHLVVDPRSSPRGTVLLYHGFTGDKHGHQDDLNAIAALGFRAVAIDAVGHGERAYSDFEERFDMYAPRRRETEFLRVVERTAQELPAVLDALGPGPFGMVGFSMGGYIGYRAATFEKRIAALCTIGASPEWRLPVPGSPHLVPQHFYPLALFSQNGALDDVVAPSGAANFATALRESYRSAPERLRHREFADGTHMLENHWEEVWSEVLAWLDRFVVP